MTKGIKWTIIGVILLFISGMIAWPHIRKEWKPKNNPTPPAASGRQGRTLNVNALVMKTQVLSDRMFTTAEIIPDEEVDLSFEVSGKIVEIFFQEDSHVHKGDLLAKINDHPLQAELHKLAAQVQLAKDRVFRQRTLLDKDAVSQEAYEQVTTEYEKLMADIELVRAHIAQTELRAPFDGIIGLRYVSEGAYASPATKIAKLTKISPLKIDFSVPEKYAEDIVPGTEVVFWISVSGSLREYRSRVYAVESKVNTTTRSLMARALYPNMDEAIRPGRSARVELTKKEIRNALAIPSEAVTQEMGKSLVYRYKSGRVEQAEVVCGIRTESQLQIIRGLNTGDTVIVSGIMQLRSGLPVVIDYIQ
ncbi:MAG: efflux RND transporter periplasmic adaptor subunit [Tannerella sp.]|jgi:membrane fusion protein (multidrug efflux system)|nr:efflux RND transporter periplasmic adaptor subunit [Tannerella sp.]